MVSSLNIFLFRIVCLFGFIPFPPKIIINHLFCFISNTWGIWVLVFFFFGLLLVPPPPQPSNFTINLQFLREISLTEKCMQNVEKFTWDYIKAGLTNYVGFDGSVTGAWRGGEEIRVKCIFILLIYITQRC